MSRRRTGVRTRTNRPGQQRLVLVVEHRAHEQRAGRLVDLRRGVVHVARVRIAVLALQPDLDRDAGEVGGPEGQRPPWRCSP